MILLFWKIVAWFKSLAVRENRNVLRRIYDNLEQRGGKLSIIDRTMHTTKKEFDANKEPFLSYVEFCRRKGISISVQDESLLEVIDKTEEMIDPNSFLDKQLKLANEEYDRNYAVMSEAGERLLGVRQDCLGTMNHVEELVNSIAAHPKEFDKDIKNISVQKKKFKDTIEFGLEQHKALENSAKRSGTGIAAGAAVASMAPTAAMWVATTFGTASTGTAISALSGAAATNAALAWLGGGALVAHGGGMAAGQALLALAGPVGWGLAGTSILASALLFWRSRNKIQENKKKEIERMKNCSERLLELHAEIEAMAVQTKDLDTKLNASLTSNYHLTNRNYKELSEEERMKLGALVNNARALSALLNKTVSE